LTNNIIPNNQQWGIQKWVFKPKVASPEGVSENAAAVSVGDVKTNTSLKASTSVAADCSAAMSKVLQWRQILAIK